jgi:hypothetical protein
VDLLNTENRRVGLSIAGGYGYAQQFVTVFKLLQDGCAVGAGGSRGFPRNFDSGA